MPTAKVNIFFNTNIKHISAGWSETYYRTDSTLKESHEKAKALATGRLPAIGGGIYLAAVRSSDVAVRGDSVIDYYNQQSFKLDLFDNICDTPWTSLLYRINSGPLYRRMHHFRGIPDDAIGTGIIASKLYGEVTKSLDAFCLQLVNDGWQLRVHQRGIDLPAVKIASIIYSPFPVVVNTQAAHGLAVGDMVKISQVKSINGKIAGLYQTASIPNATQYTLAGAEADPTAVYVSGGLSQEYELAYKAITDGQQVRISHKQTGRPFGLTVGSRHHRVKK